MLQRIWDAHGLGRIGHTTSPPGGSINACFIVDDRYVIRLNTLPERGLGRFRGEAAAYRMLAGSGVPVPEVIAMDVSCEFVPYEYLITSKLPGEMLWTAWEHLPDDQRQRACRDAGTYLALIHRHTVGRFGSLRALEVGQGFERWSDYVADTLERYCQKALALEVFGQDVAERVRAVMAHASPLMDAIREGVLVHSDYHFGNLLHVDGRVSGLIDFEWALSGDPAWDLFMEARWDRMCPGSRDAIMAAYTALQPVDEQDWRRVLVYRLVMRIEFALDSKQRGHEEKNRVDLQKLMAVLEQAEQEFRG